MEITKRIKEGDNKFVEAGYNLQTPQIVDPTNGGDDGAEE